MKRLYCKLFGHKLVTINYVTYCKRCNQWFPLDIDVDLTII